MTQHDDSVDEETLKELNFQVSGSQEVTADAVKISGSARIHGGIVPKFIKIGGKGRIDSDIEFNGLRCGGSLHGGGSIVSHGNIHVSGSFHGESNVISDGDFHVSGSAKIEGDIDAQGVVSVSGSMKSGGNINGKGGIRVSGSGKVDGSMFSENEIHLKGKVKVEGNLNANSVKFKAPNPFRRFAGKRSRSQVDGYIHGSELVDIDNIHVDGDVRGRVVKIGHNSKIVGVIEFVDDLVLANDVEVENPPVKVAPESIEIPAQSPSGGENTST